MDDLEDGEDAYGRTGVRVECWVCHGSGTEYDETCVTCGGYGWINEPQAIRSRSMAVVGES